MTITGYIDRKTLEKAVYEKLNEVGISKDDYPINPYMLIENEGIVLQEVRLDDENIRGMIVHGANKTGILVNANRCYVSRRFIAMHELCHYWFHPKEAKRVCFEEYKTIYRGIEWQANNAASYALMPKEIVFELYDHFNGEIEYMAEYLMVSTPSMTYRAKELGLLIKNKNIYVPSAFYYENDPMLSAWEDKWLYGGL